MSPDGSDRVQITHDGGFDASPSWSPDGARIVYASDAADSNRPACEAGFTCNRDVFVVNADGSNRTRLTDDPAADWQPSWSPDGARIAFVSARNDPGAPYVGGHVFVMNAGGTDVTQLTSGSEADLQPRWSPDGGRIAFVREEGDAFALMIMNADGSRQTQLATGLPSTASVEPDLFQDFAWAPDGTMIAFISGGEAGTTLSVVRTDGTGRTDLVEDRGNGLSAPAWRPIAAPGS
jgi:Tol biopolymer transport system component